MYAGKEAMELKATKTSIDLPFLLYQSRDCFLHQLAKLYAKNESEYLKKKLFSSCIEYFWKIVCF